MAIKVDQSPKINPDVAPNSELDTDLTESKATSKQDLIRGAHTEAQALNDVRDRLKANQRLEEIRALEGVEKVEDNSNRIAKEEGVERVKENQESNLRGSESEDLSRLKGDGSGDSSNKIRKETPRASEKINPKESSKLKDNTRQALVKDKQQENRELINNIEGQEKVEDQVRIKKEPSGAETDAKIKKEATVGGEQNRSVALKGVPLKGARLATLAPNSVSDTRTKQQLAKVAQEAKQKQVEEELKRSISESEGLEKILDKSRLDQTKALKESDLKDKQEVQGESTNDPALDIDKTKRANKTDTGGLDVKAVDADTKLKTATNQTNNSSANDSANQLNELARIAKNKQEQLEESIKNGDISEINLDIPSGFSPQRAAEIHRDLRDIRALLVLADAYQILEDRIQGDLLAASVPANEAPSFGSSNLQAVTLASKRFKDQVGDVLPWQRFGV